MLITDIVFRLPVKPLLRFRCLSKTCCVLIDDPDFINHHLRLSIHTRSNLNLVLKNLHLYSVDLDSLDTAVALDYPVSLSGRTEAFCSSNGLIALRSSDRDIGLYNPSTRKRLKLPVEPVDPTGDSSRSPGYVFYGFGYDSVSDDYKVVRMVKFNKFEDNDRHGDGDGDGGDNNVGYLLDYEVKVYSLRKNSWKRVYMLSLYLSFMFRFFYHLLHRRGYGVLVSGVLHWIFPKRPELNAPNFIVGFDLGAEAFLDVPQPD
ncbi:hypothetical protein CFOL_v3_26836 [Cephalotus follicularis]|uniref:F-box domain-containing protein n=1 Tax=Cephalotus follicularis TaxID=3775 RepID=A0A1Q3CTL8_CEPFO|nr:hypothetical protein CFOL_v3_26836 [Cephalotus follicularis]